MPWAWAYPVSSGIAISVAPARPNAAESHVPSVVTPSFASSDISVEVATCAGATQRGKVSHDRWRRAGNGTAGNAQSVGGRQLTAIDTVHHGDSVRTHSQPASPSARPYQQRHACVAWHRTYLLRLQPEAEENCAAHLHRGASTAAEVGRVA